MPHPLFELFKGPVFMGSVYEGSYFKAPLFEVAGTIGS
jgi:hypothetical protein